MKFKKFTALLLAALLVLSLAACGTKDNDKMADMSGDSSAMTGEPLLPSLPTSFWTGRGGTCPVFRRKRHRRRKELRF